MENEIEIGVTTITNVIEITAQPTDQIIDIGVTDNTDEVVINVTPSVIEININKGGLNSNLVTSVNGEIGDVVLDKNDIGLGNVDNTADYDKMISLDTQIALNNKADLVDGLVPSYQLPSYVDDVLEVANYVSLPLVGEIGKIYITLDNNKIYRWTGSIYIEIASNNAIWGAITGTLSNQTDLQNALNAKVPYTGATSDVNLGEFGIQLGNLEFDLTPTNAPTNVGSLSWNDSDGTLDLKLKGGNVTLQLGQETVARIVNKTATNITLSEGNYQAVRVTGAIGQRPKVDLALADNDLNSTTTLGLVTETILNNQEGFITTSGQVRGINTTGSLQGETWLDGDILYLSGTVAGAITNIKPVAPIHTVIIGFVEHAHITQGKIFVKVDNGYELNELHNVSAIAPNNNEVLAYDLATTLWKPKTVTTALGYTPENITNKSTSTTLGISDTLYPTQNAVKTYVDSKISYGDFANVVYFNSTNPSTATIFDLNNPPVLNDNALKADTGNLYIGTDNSTWTYKTSPAGYYTYTITSSSSNFYLLGTTTDAGNNKTSAIERNDSIKSPKFITTGGTSSQFVKGDGSLDSSVIALDSNVVHLTGTETITGTKTFDTNSIYKGSLILSQTTSATSTPGYMSLSGTTSGISLYDGSNVNRNINLKVTNVTALRNIEFPNASGTLALTSDLSSYVPTSRTITINGDTQSLSSDITFTVSGGITGSGITGKIPLFTSPNAIGNSSIEEFTGYLSVLKPININYATSTSTNGLTVSLGSATSTGATLNLYNAGTGDIINAQGPSGSVFKILNSGATNFQSSVTTGGILSSIVNSSANTVTANFMQYPLNPLGIEISSNATSGTQSIQAKYLNNSAYFNLALNPSGGNVGIGTINPDAKLEVRLDNAGNIGGYLNVTNKIDSATVGHSVAINMGLSSTGEDGFRFLTKSPTSYGNTPDLLIQSQSNGVFSNRLIIKNDGLIGIGIDIPTEKLHVVGNGLFTGNVTATTGVNITSGGVTSTIVNASSIFTLGTTSAHSLTLRTNNVVRATIDSSGTTTLSSLAGTGTRTVVASSTGVLSASSTSTPTYKVYTALIGQTGTSSPTVTILENTIGSIVWSYVSPGVYYGTLTGAFIASKTTCQISTISNMNNSNFALQRNNNSNQVFLQTLLSGTQTNGLLPALNDNSPKIEIRVYN